MTQLVSLNLERSLYNNEWLRDFVYNTSFFIGNIKYEKIKRQKLFPASEIQKTL